MGKNGKRGPTPKPIAALRRSGSNQIYNRQDELEVPVGMPDMPEWLEEKAQGVWDETVRKLYLLGVIAVIDQGVLALYCYEYGLFLELIDSYDITGVIKTTTTGATKLNPAHEAAGKAWDRILKISKELGLTPAARAGLAPGGTKRPAEKKSNRFFLKKGPA
jgi:P27 family predicted phage terminase small subunit